MLRHVLGYDECNPPDDVHTADCGENEQCVNTDLSYDCVCKEGFENKSTGCVGECINQYKLHCIVVKYALGIIVGV
jgi:hypothetical protein